MPYTKLSEAPPSLRGIKPAITLAQANGIARCADALEEEGKVESPWAVCISSFKKSHVVKDGKWVEHEGSKSMDTVEIDGAEVRLEELVAAYKAIAERKQLDELPSLESNALKAISIEGDEMRVGNYIALFGTHDLSGIVGASPHKAGEFFTAQTEFESDYTRAGTVCVDFDHGLKFTGAGSDMDAPGRDDILGYVDWGTVKADSRGLWVERVLNRRNLYMQFLEQLIEAGLIGTSSECVSRGAKKAEDGRIEVWPLRRDTLTVSPMEWRMMTENPLVAKAIGGLLNGLDLPQLNEGGDASGDACRKAEVEKEQARIESMLLEIELAEAN